MVGAQNRICSLQCCPASPEALRLCSGAAHASAPNLYALHSWTQKCRSRPQDKPLPWNVVVNVNSKRTNGTCIRWSRRTLLVGGTFKTEHFLVERGTTPECTILRIDPKLTFSNLNWFHAQQPLLLPPISVHAMHSCIIIHAIHLSLIALRGQSSSKQCIPPILIGKHPQRHIWMQVFRFNVGVCEQTIACSLWERMQFVGALN